jgi:hypothetical protein
VEDEQIVRTYWRVELVIYEYEQGDEEDDLVWHMDAEEVVSIHDDRDEAHRALEAAYTLLLHEEDICQDP